MIELVKTSPPNPQASTRRKKIHYGFYDRKPLTPHPVIHLGGRYLERYGFTIGEMIEVHLESGSIRITKALTPQEQK